MPGWFRFAGGPPDPDEPDWEYVRRRNQRLLASRRQQRNGAQPPYPAPPVTVMPDGTHAPVTGSHNHHHRLYGTQEKGTFHSHEHEHGVRGVPDANHGHHDSQQVDTEGLARLMTEGTETGDAAFTSFAKWLRDGLKGK